MGEFKNNGREWNPKVEAQNVSTHHDFPDKSRTRPFIAYGVYDLAIRARRRANPTSQIAGSIAVAIIGFDRENTKPFDARSAAACNGTGAVLETQTCEVSVVQA